MINTLLPQCLYHVIEWLTSVAAALVRCVLCLHYKTRDKWTPLLTPSEQRFNTLVYIFGTFDGERFYIVFMWHYPFNIVTYGSEKRGLNWGMKPRSCHSIEIKSVSDYVTSDNCSGYFCSGVTNLGLVISVQNSKKYLV